MNNDSLKDAIDDIIVTLTEQSNYSEELIKLSDEKLLSVKENNVDSILKITQDEERIASKMIQLEKDRDSLIKRIEKIKDTKITNISSLISEFSEEESCNIKLIAEKLKDNFEILKQKNDINKSLLEVILDQVEIYNNLIIGDQAPKTYENTKFKKEKYSSKDIGVGSFDKKY